MRTGSGRLERIVRLAVGLCFALQAMVVPGLHHHPADGHDPGAAVHGWGGSLADGAQFAVYGTELAAHSLLPPGSHHGSAYCPACLFLKNFQGRTGAGKIPVPVLAPDSRAPQGGDHSHRSRTVISSFPRAPPHHA
jgi:hypothetical protein